MVNNIRKRNQSKHSYIATHGVGLGSCGCIIKQYGLVAVFGNNNNRENFENKIEPGEPRGFGVVSVYTTKVRNSSPFNRNSSSLPAFSTFHVFFVNFYEKTHKPAR